jgi:hypothetical protein
MRSKPSGMLHCSSGNAYQKQSISSYNTNLQKHHLDNIKSQKHTISCIFICVELPWIWRVWTGMTWIHHSILKHISYTMHYNNLFYSIMYKTFYLVQEIIFLNMYKTEYNYSVQQLYTDSNCCNTKASEDRLHNNLNPILCNSTDSNQFLILHATVPRYILWNSKCEYKYTGLFISSSGISEINCATTKTDTAERSISIGRESLKVFFCTRGLGLSAASVLVVAQSSSEIPEGYS